MVSPNGDYIVKFTPMSDVMRVKESSQEVNIIPDNETSLNVLAAQMVYTNIKKRVKALVQLIILQ